MASTLLVAVDFEDASHRAIGYAKQLAGPLGATLALVHVYQLPVYTYPGLDPSILPGFHHEVMVAAREALEQLARAEGVPSTMLHDGDPAREILEAARECGASMIIMGTHGRRGLSHALLGSVAEKVIRQSDVPVITLRAQAT
jgi:nucleotide-binding universal stress UspA family protein